MCLRVAEAVADVDTDFLEYSPAQVKHFQGDPKPGLTHATCLHCPMHGELDIDQAYQIWAVNSKSPANI